MSKLLHGLMHIWHVIVTHQMIPPFSMIQYGRSKSISQGGVGGGIYKNMENIMNILNMAVKSGGG